MTIKYIANRVKRELNILFWVTMGIFFLGFLFGRTAQACSSYDECIKTGETGGFVPGETTNNGYLKAIAYKLNEISNKLDRLPQADPFQQIAVKQASKNR